MADHILADKIISLTFAPKFGAPHWHELSRVENDIRYHVDTNLAGRTRVFNPTESRKRLEIGRAPGCWVRIGFNPDSRHDRSILAERIDPISKLPIFNNFSRKHVTFELIKDRWFVIPGGEFRDRETGLNDWGFPLNFVYLNGVRLQNVIDPVPLFPEGSTVSKLQLGPGGKIIVTKGPMDTHTTGWPLSIWQGEGWPDMKAETAAHCEIAKVEHATVEAQIPRRPASWADVAVLVINGPPSVDDRLWWAFLVVVGISLGVVWALLH